MSEESDFRDVLLRAVEAGAFDDCWDAVGGDGVPRWREACVERARDMVGDLDGWEIVGVEAASFEGRKLRPKFLIVPRKKETGQ